MTVAYTNEQERERGLDAMRPRLAFYGSTPAYRPVLDAHGWGDLQPELNRLSKHGDWATMATLITDEMVDALCVVGADRRDPRVIHERYGDIVQRISVDKPRADVAALRGGT